MERFQLTFNAGKTVPDSGKHYFAVYYIKATDENKAPRACWSDHKGDPNGTKRWNKTQYNNNS